MECPICAMWYRMPYHKRFSSPVTVEQAEEALAIGYWLRANSDGEVIPCKRHLDFFRLLDTEKTVPMPIPMQPFGVAAPIAPVRTIAMMTAPVTNGNLSTSPPPVPIVEQPAMATVITPLAQPAKEGANIPEIEKRSYRCPVCHKVAILGDVHLCE